MHLVCLLIEELLNEVSVINTMGVGEEGKGKEKEV